MKRLLTLATLGIIALLAAYALGATAPTDSPAVAVGSLITTAARTVQPGLAPFGQRLALALSHALPIALAVGGIASLAVTIAIVLLDRRQWGCWLWQHPGARQ